MVLSDDREFMATGPEGSKPLHNFTLPYLKWGNQRQLRCMKIEPASRSGGGDHHRLRRRSPLSKLENSSEVISARFWESEHRNKNQHRRCRAAPSRSGVDGGEEGIDEFREKIMSDLRTVADKMKESIFRKEESDDEEYKGEDTDGEERQKERHKPKQKEKEKEKKLKETEKEREVSPTAAAEQVRPWNLRNWRAACKASIGGAGNNDSNGHQYNNSNYSNKGLRIGETRVNSSPLRNDTAKSPRLGKRERERTGAVGAEKKERPKFSVPLTSKEIEEDFMELLGHRPLRRPKKRPRTVQKQLDFLFPGLYLTEVRPDSYSVHGIP